ncbi:MAG: thioredoxin-disulfide reductase [Candidatus Methylomirabilales bacterium]
MEVQVCILGSGPAGLTAALYAARGNLAPLVIAGAQPGGQLTTTTMVENYPGFPDGIMGPELMEIWKKHAERFGTRYLAATVTKVDLAKRPFMIETDEVPVRCRALIIATGATPNLLGLPSEQQYMGRGVSTCATCDGYFFKDQEVAVVGGGDAAMEEALYLSKLCTKVTVIHRRDKLRASKIMAERAQKNPRIAFQWNSAVEEILGKEDHGIRGVRLRRTDTGERAELKVDGLFIAIGHSPNTGLFQGQLDMDGVGYLRVTEGTMTNVPGVFAAGDVVDHVYRQAVTAASMGCMAAMDAERWLERQGE